MLLSEQGFSQSKRTESSGNRSSASVVISSQNSITCKSDIIENFILFIFRQRDSLSVIDVGDFGEDRCDGFFGVAAQKWHMHVCRLHSFNVCYKSLCTQGIKFIQTQKPFGIEFTGLLERLS